MFNVQGSTQNFYAELRCPEWYAELAEVLVEGVKGLRFNV